MKTDERFSKDPAGFMASPTGQPIDEGGTRTVYECATCGALVPWLARDRHNEWHNQSGRK